MSKIDMTKNQMKELISVKLSHLMGVTPRDASDEHFYKALAYILRDMMAQRRKEQSDETYSQGEKKICYLCMEFLMGRSLKNTLYNLGLTGIAAQALADYGVRLDKLYDCEPDAGLGNGGLGRLAACYLDALASGGYYATGYSILYEYGIFKQKLVDGWQTELPDFWLPGGEAWLVPHDESSVEVCFEGSVSETWEEHYHHVELTGCKTVTAVPYDMYVAGKDGKGVSVLRLWSAKARGLDMEKFSRGDYLSAMEQTAMAETISKVLYPADNHPEGKSLRLRQQYFLVSASIQDIVKTHLRANGTLEDLPEKIAIHINDTHPTMAIPELMRIMLDECGYGWDDAWRLVTKTFAYTNHTVMEEALECWSVELVERLLPRIYQIICEIDRRFREQVMSATGDPGVVSRTAIIENGAVRMANLCVAACHSVNGVSELHSRILRDEVFSDFYRVMPQKFTNVTNGIAYRRWLCQSNPGLCDLISGLIGDGFVNDASELVKLKDFSQDVGVLAAMKKIKRDNKERFAALIKKSSGEIIDPDSLFDVQVKRLHEYKRQHLNALSILADYLAIKENPNGDFVPRTCIFAAKAAPGYFIAKKIIAFICALAKQIDSDPDVRGRLKVIFVEDYNVTLAEALMPSADISEQISLAGKEASGTGNMKLMINGAVTLGTLDGANIEIYDAVGDDNIFIFGMTKQEVADLSRRGYNPHSFYDNNSELRGAIDFAGRGLAGLQLPEITSTILYHDPFMVLADFADYSVTRRRACRAWLDDESWNRMSLFNVASAGRFSADRAVDEYAKNIWGLR